MARYTACIKVRAITLFLKLGNEISFKRNIKCAYNLLET
jgi:hypothetical protein